MRRGISGWALALALSFLVAAPGASPLIVSPRFLAAAAAPARIMVVGDSISQGLEGDYTWRYRLQQHLSAVGGVDFVGPWTGTNRVLPQPGPAAHDGAYRPGISFTDNQNLAQWGWQLAQAKWEIAANVRTYSPDYLLVELGFNDIAWGVSSPTGTIDSLRELVTNARAANPGIKVLVANVVHRSPLDNQPDLPQKISSYNDLLPGFVTSASTAASPVAAVNLDAAYSYGTDAYDGLHPNVRGEFVIAKSFAGVLASRFGLGSPLSIPGSLPTDLTPAAPASITVTAVGTSLQVSWAHSFGAGGYQLFRRDVTLGEAFVPYIYSIGADSWTEGVPAAGHTYAFYAKAERGPQRSSPSATATGTAKPLPVVPNLTGTSITDRPYAAKLTWSAVPDADDYHVYAAGSANSCDFLPPARSEFKLVQWSLGNKTTWTQEYVFDLCVWYYVVASRYGGEGAFQTVPVRVLPYENNINNYYARNRFFDQAVESGDAKSSAQVSTGPDHGIVVARGFIRDADSFTATIGDHRQFDSFPYASSKIGVAWDTSTGEIGIYVHRSCAAGATFLWRTYLLACHDAFPIQVVPDATIYKDDNESKVNYVSVNKSGNNLTLSVSAINSWEGWNPADFGRINAKVTLTAAGQTYNVSMRGDKFPAWEFYRYPRFDGFPAGFTGTFRTLGTRDQTSLGDLKAPQVTCTSTGEGNGAATRPMVCS